MVNRKTRKVGKVGGASIMRRLSNATSRISAATRRLSSIFSNKVIQEDKPYDPTEIVGKQEEEKQLPNQGVIKTREGDFKYTNTQHGPGTLKIPGLNKDDFIKGKITSVIMKYDNKDKYTGHWHYVKRRQGHGIMTYENGNKLEGEWKDDKMQGKGVLTFKVRIGEGKENVLEGEWKDDKFKNKTKAKIQYHTGDIYEGIVKQDDDHYLKNGKGTMKYEDKGKYVGYWKDDMKDGKGNMIYPNGSSYDGEWKEDQREGRGIMTDENGNIYHGTWKKDAKDGKGTLATKNRKTVNQTWNKGKLIN